jgi:CubicO group peptidase (beta-lactamase class C family)
MELYRSIISLLILVIFKSLVYSSENGNEDRLISNLATQKSWIDSIVEKEMVEYDIPGAALVMVKGKRVIHSKGYGIGNIESGMKIDDRNSLFHIASISKTFLAVATMRLVGDGKIELDDDINKHLKSFHIDPLEGEPITIKDLLHHTAGFSERNIGTTSLEKGRGYSLSKYLEEMIPNQITPAGKIYSYSNFGMALLGLIIEEVSGQSYSEYLTREILLPLEMRTTGFDMREEWKERYIKSYDLEGGMASPIHTGFDKRYPSGGIITTTSEMGNFLIMLLNGGSFKGKQVVDSLSIKKIFETEFTYIEGSSSAQVFGFMKQEDYDGVTVYYKSGGLFGFSSLIFLIPEKEFALFAIVNAPDIMKEVGSAFNFGVVNNYLWSRLDLGSSTTPTDKRVPKEVIPSKPLTNYLGTYRYCVRYSPDSLEKLAALIGMFPDLEVRLEDGKLINSFGETLIPIGKDTFYERGSGYQLKFETDSEDRVTHCLYEGINGYVKIKWYESIKLQKVWSVVIIVLPLLYTLFFLIKITIRRREPVQKIEKISFIISTLILIFAVVLISSLTLVPFQDYGYGVPLALKIGLVIPFLVIFLEFWGVVTFLNCLKDGKMSPSTIAIQSIIMVTYISFIPWLLIWNLLGFNY